MVALSLALAATTLVGGSVQAASGTRDCTDKGKILVEARTSQAVGASVTARAVGSPGSGTTWGRTLTPKAGIISIVRWGFATPVVNGSWGASGITSDAPFSAYSQCTQGSTTSDPLRATVNLGSKDCPAGQNVMMRGDTQATATGVLRWTHSGSATERFVSSPSQRINMNIVDTGRNNVASASVKVYADFTIPAGDQWIYITNIFCSGGTTTGD
jgi:hypothetical protein